MTQVVLHVRTMLFNILYIVLKSTYYKPDPSTLIKEEISRKLTRLVRFLKVSRCPKNLTFGTISKQIHSSGLFFPSEIHQYYNTQNNLWRIKGSHLLIEEDHYRHLLLTLLRRSSAVILSILHFRHIDYDHLGFACTSVSLYPKHSWRRRGISLRDAVGLKHGLWKECQSGFESFTHAHGRKILVFHLWTRSWGNYPFLQWSQE